MKDVIRNSRNRATWQAVKRKFKNVIIMSFLFHASENMRKRFGPLCRSRQKHSGPNCSREKSGTQSHVATFGPECF